MASQRGRDLLLKIWDGAAFVTVAGMRAHRILLNSQAVDSTDAGSMGQWRELLAGAGLKRISVSGSGIFKDAASDELVRTAFFAGALPNWQLIVPDFGRIEGSFQVATLEYGGLHDGEVTFQLALESAGALTFTAI